MSDPRIVPLPLNPSNYYSEEGAPPPKAAFMIFDRPAVESTEGLTYQSMPMFIVQLFLFGRQTDREARLQLVGATAPELPKIKALFNESFGQWLSGDEKIEEIATASATMDMLQPKWRPPVQLKQPQLHAILEEYRRDAILNRWPDMKLGVLDGLSPSQAAADAKYHIKLPAAIMVLQFYADSLHWSFDLNHLRGRLGLPTLGPIEAPPGQVNQIPLVRLARVTAPKNSPTKTWSKPSSGPWVTTTGRPL